MRQSSFNKKNSNGTGISVPFLSLLISGLVLFLSVGTVAWLANNRDVSSSNMAMSVNGSNLELSCAVYKYSILDEEVVTQDVEEDLEINKYDLVFSDQNDFNPVIFEMTISGDSLSNDGGTLSVKITRDADIDALTEDSTLTGYSSNVMCFCVLPSATTLEITKSNFTDCVDLFTGTKENFFSSLTLSSDSTVSDYSKDESITLEVSYPSGSYDAESNADTVKVYLMLTYDTYNAYSYGEGSEDLISLYVNGQGVNATDIGVAISIANDILSISVSADEG